MKRCKHRLLQKYVMSRDVFVDGRWRMMVWQQCDCGVWLSLGPATDDERTAVEVRAAEIAASWKSLGGVKHIATTDEKRGWSGWPYRQPLDDAELTGFLAAQIRNHERDIGEVNWAGQHMADHDLTHDTDGGGE